ncbi:MAG: efflux RND transporter periplasmic adaptor subunit [Gammaproteobacteria bacterium]|nr:efflux RND transporter periplasmic adaptor subunit [Gammaproteobacteria bacterium]NNL52260.1 efflux RND transporter periplasmic adaptor subunit [Woeseiaceae bacterium]
MHIRLMILVAIALVAACSEETAQSARGGWGAAPKIVTAAAALRPMIDEIQALGTARANESIEIRPRIASLVDRVAFEEGQMVQKGDLLVELENSEIKAGLALAKASLSESRSLYDRSKSLASSQAISASNLETLLAKVLVDEAQVQAAQARLANTRIIAPFAGRVGLRRVSPGGLVSSQDVITTLDDVRKIKLDFSVPETFLTVVKEGMQIRARSVVFPDRVFEGTITSIDTRLDPVSRAVQIRALIPNDDGGLKPGMFMTVDLQRDRGEVLVVLEQAIVPEGTLQFVYVVNEGVAEKRQVVIGRRIPGFVVIRDGLKPGERVITEGTAKVRDGSQVEDLRNADI